MAELSQSGKRYHAHRAAGLCGSCNNPSEKAVCALCWAVRRRWVAGRPPNMCHYCHRQVKIPGLQSCRDCNKTYRARAAKNYHERRAAGLCVYATCRNKPEQGKSLCPTHLAVYAALNRAARARARARASTP